MIRYAKQVRGSVLGSQYPVNSVLEGVWAIIKFHVGTFPCVERGDNASLLLSLWQAVC